MDAIASTIGTALGNTHGSCLPPIDILVLLKESSTLFCSLCIDEIGLKATLKTQLMTDLIIE